MSRRNRGRRSRRRATNASQNGGKRSGRRSGIRRNLLEPAAMVSRLTTGSMDPETVRYSITTNHRVQLINPASAAGSTISTVTVANMFSVIPGGTTAWRAFRIKKISAYGSDSTAISTTSYGIPPFGILMNTVDADGGALGDQAEFHDFGTAGQERAQVHVLPAFAVREYWFTSALTTTTLFTVAGGSTSSATGSGVIPCVINVSLELESVPLTTLPSIRAQFESLSVGP